jgi:broad specificity phosphatase PhoE
MKTIDLYLVRHGETSSNVEKVNGGPNVPLNQNGIRQAKKLFESKLLPQEPDKTFSSPLMRALETARLATRTEIVQNALLAERNFGKYIGKSWKEIFARIRGKI